MIRRGNGQQGYVPANYVKEIEPAIVTQKVKKTVVEEVPVVVKRKQKVKKRAKPIQRKRGTRTFSCKIVLVDATIFKLTLQYLFTVYGGYSQLKSEGQNVATRQRSINTSYEMLVKLAEERHKCLIDSIRLFKLCSECDEVEAWVKEKEAVLQAKEKGTTKEQMDSMQKKYDVRLSVD